MNNKANRYNQEKLQWSLVDFNSFEDMVKVLEFGANKYDAFNWTKGLTTQSICESMLRHTFAFMSGEDKDKESGLSHVGHIQCNAMFLAYMLKNKPEFDNRFNKTNNMEIQENITNTEASIIKVQEEIHQLLDKITAKLQSLNSKIDYLLELNKSA